MSNNKFKSKVEEFDFNRYYLQAVRQQEQQGSSQ